MTSFPTFSLLMFRFLTGTILTTTPHLHPPYYDRISRSLCVPACRSKHIRFHSKPLPCLVVIFTLLSSRAETKVFTVVWERYRYQLLRRLMFLEVVPHQSRGQINFFCLYLLFIFKREKKDLPIDLFGLVVAFQRIDVNADVGWFRCVIDVRFVRILCNRSIT